MCKKGSHACLMAEERGEPKLSDELRLGNPDCPPDCPPPGLIISGGTRRTPCWQGWKKRGLKKTSPVGFFGFFRFFLYVCPEDRVFRVFSVSRILLGASRL
jgi:hypothetical protein